MKKIFVLLFTTLGLRHKDYIAQGDAWQNEVRLALAAGDITRLSTNLVAFTTTVVGVFLGSVAFSMSLLRKCWYAGDLSDLEHVFVPPRENPADHASKET